MTKSKDNPISKRPPRQLSEEELSRFVNNVHGPREFAKRVIFGHQIEHYGDQIREYINKKANEFPDMAEGKVWKKKTLKNMARFEGGVRGYAWDENRGAAYTTTDYKSGKLSASLPFSCTIETADRTKRICGYMTVIILAAITIWLAWEVSKGLKSGFFTFENYAQHLLEFYNPEK